ncbi:MAG: SprT family zinc-dependent metalloprotease [Armatimonadota bacterium]
MNVKIDKIIKSKRRTLSLEVNRDACLIVRAPYNTPEREIHDFIRRKNTWIIKHQSRIKEKNTKTASREFITGEEFLCAGKKYKLFVTDKIKHPLIFTDNCFILKEESSKEAKKLFVKWYKNYAYRIIAQRVRFYSSYYGFEYNNIKITSASKRWGSCTSKGNLNFSFFLAMAPMQIIDYVVVHELVHLKVKNHSKKFWKAVESILPDYKKRRKWLKENELLLTI